MLLLKGHLGRGSTCMAMKAKVLIVDDEPDVLESTGLLIEALGYEAIQVSEPGDILDTVEREKPGLILQDLKMPGLNVAGLVAALRLNPRTAEVPLVFFSAGTDLATTAARYDAWGYLAKPFGKAELARLLKQVLGPAGGPTNAPAGRDMQREVRAVFHDYWNLLAALSNYILVLDETPGLPPEAQKSVKGLDELIMKLESKTDRLSTYIRALVNSLEASPGAMHGPQAPAPAVEPLSGA
ncbi:MAG: two-component system, NtrC family, response regulator AtoC [Thermoplasmata archaeon]|jgi:CheY-like chemotaxis protein|nr:two-component system, NtrC family, response regulator AtoC [Thermoplasmata archaeon]MEA3165702.1 two-component system, NtrC family, response regulator AtoC [Thermoplasmata archaeon]